MVERPGILINITVNVADRLIQLRITIKWSTDHFLLARFTKRNSWPNAQIILARFTLQLNGRTPRYTH